MFETKTLFWIGFILFVLIALFIDLFFSSKKNHETTIKEAIRTTLIWIGLAMIFNLIVYFQLGQTKALEFFTGYIIEKSLSVDNLFVFIMIFSYFKIDKKHQHKILFWGIVGALIMRIIFIFAGIKLIENFQSIIYIFGGFLILSSIKMFFESEKEEELEEKFIMKFVNKLIPVFHGDNEGKFFIKKKGKVFATTLFISLIIIEFTDLIFAIDSVPAVLSISNDIFIVYTSNIFAILGLRALYFAINTFMASFYYLKYGLASILLFVGIKMLISNYYHIPTLYSLLIIIFILSTSIIASKLHNVNDGK